MVEISPLAKELSLCIINDGGRYKERCRIFSSTYSNWYKLPAMISQIRLYVIRNMKDWRGIEFEVEDILGTVAELCSYYEQHDKEMKDDTDSQRDSGEG